MTDSDQIRRIQQVKATLDKVRYTKDILLPHELLHGASAIHKQCSMLVPHTLQSRALRDHVAFVPNCTLVTQQTQALGPRGATILRCHRTFHACKMGRGLGSGLPITCEVLRQAKDGDHFVDRKQQ